MTHYQEDYGEFYWKRYEIENYFITPKVVYAFVRKALTTLYGDLFFEEPWKKFERIFEEFFLLPIFNHNQKAVEEFKALPENLKDVQFENFASSKKVSMLLENTFSEFAAQNQQQVLLTKGNYYQLVELMEVAPESEVTQKLDWIVMYLSN